MCESPGSGSKTPSASTTGVPFAAFSATEAVPVAKERATIADPLPSTFALSQTASTWPEAVSITSGRFWSPAVVWPTTNSEPTRAPVTSKRCPSTADPLPSPVLDSQTTTNPSSERVTVDS